MIIVVFSTIFVYYTRYIFHIDYFGILFLGAIIPFYFLRSDYIYVCYFPK